VEVKAGNPVDLLDGEVSPPILRAYFELCHLKQLYRQGWLRRGVPRARCESVAEHSFAVAVLGMWLSQAYFPELDQARVLRMALLHDLGEVYAGDIIPGDGVPEDEKRRRESSAIEQVLGKLPGGVEFISLWEEFEAGQTAESRFVRQVDRLEMGLQAGVYSAQGFDGLGEFYQSAQKALSNTQLVELLQALR
jgi:putative hydrolase of HD superfamily